MVRFGERMGEDVMHRHANKLQTAFENAMGGDAGRAEGRRRGRRVGEARHARIPGDRGL